MQFGSLEFECAVIFVMCLCDMILGTISHVFFKKDNSSESAETSIGRKLVIMITLIGILIIVHLNDYNSFNQEVKSVLQMANNTASAVVVIFLYYELTSVLRHISDMTGIDLSKIPGVQQEIDSHKKG